jgi:WD repeat-containing protein 35
MNLTLEGHTGSVMCTTWNPLFRKLTTSDESGLIIVWMLHKGIWCEEMINNRNKSVVRDMKWTSDGKKICIIYEDGAVIVGSVDGNRIWGKELNMPLRFVEWSPDSKLIFFVTMESEVWVYDSDGTRVRSMSLSALDPTGTSDVPIIGVHWHCQDGPVRIGSGLHYTHAEANPTLCIALQSGMILLSRGDEDNNSIVVNTEMTITCCKWDTSGNVLAITGSMKSSSEKVIIYI